MDNVVEAVIEIPMGTKNKFEIDKKTKKIKLDRVLYSSLSYPGEYGFIDETLADDNDPLDILIISSSPTFPGCIVDARILGYLEIIDNGDYDQKLIAVVDKDPRFKHLNDIDDVNEHIKEEIKDFFQNYKHLQKIKVITKNFHNKDKALNLIKKCKENYKRSN